MTYISAAELARRCEVSRAAVSLAIKEHRISPDRVHREGKRVLIDAKHGISVLGHHRSSKPAPSPVAPAAVNATDDLAGLLAWGAAPIIPGEPDELTGAAEVANLEQQIELQNLVAWWEGEYSDFRGWITSHAVGEIMRELEEHPAARHAACESIAAVQKKLRDGMDRIAAPISADHLTPPPPAISDSEAWENIASWANSLLALDQWGPPPWPAVRWATLRGIIDDAENLAAAHGPFDAEVQARLEADQ